MNQDLVLLVPISKMLRWALSLHRNHRISSGKDLSSMIGLLALPTNHLISALVILPLLPPHLEDKEEGPRLLIMLRIGGNLLAMASMGGNPFLVMALVAMDMERAVAVVVVVIQGLIRMPILTRTPTFRPTRTQGLEDEVEGRHSVEAKLFRRLSKSMLALLHRLATLDLLRWLRLVIH